MSLVLYAKNKIKSNYKDLNRNYGFYLYTITKKCFQLTVAV